MIFDSVFLFKQQTPSQGRLLCLDVGTVRIGIAHSDFLQAIATPFGVYTRRNMRQDMGYLNDVISAQEAVAVVIGLPLALDGTEGENCLHIRQFAKNLYKKSALPILLVDERMSTAAVTRDMKAHHVKRKDRHAKDDELAATYILQGVL